MKQVDIHSLSHTQWECKYHIVFVPKYRRKVFYGQKRYEIGQILRELCKWKGVNMLGSEYVRGRSLSRSYTYTIRNTTKNQYIQFYGISERGKQLDDI